MYVCVCMDGWKRNERKICIKIYTEKNANFHIYSCSSLSSSSSSMCFSFSFARVSTEWRHNKCTRECAHHTPKPYGRLYNIFFVLFSFFVWLFSAFFGVILFTFFFFIVFFLFRKEYDLIRRYRFQFTTNIVKYYIFSWWTERRSDRNETMMNEKDSPLVFLIKYRYIRAYAFSFKSSRRRN